MQNREETSFRSTAAPVYTLLSKRMSLQSSTPSISSYSIRQGSSQVSTSSRVNVPGNWIRGLKGEIQHVLSLASSMRIILQGFSFQMSSSTSRIFTFFHTSLLNSQSTSSPTFKLFLHQNLPLVSVPAGNTSKLYLRTCFYMDGRSPWQATVTDWELTLIIVAGDHILLFDPESVFKASTTQPALKLNVNCLSYYSSFSSNDGIIWVFVSWWFSLKNCLSRSSTTFTILTICGYLSSSPKYLTKKFRDSSMICLQRCIASANLNCLQYMRYLTYWERNSFMKSFCGFSPCMNSLKSLQRLKTTNHWQSSRMSGRQCCSLLAVMEQIRSSLVLRSFSESGCASRCLMNSSTSKTVVLALYMICIIMNRGDWLQNPLFSYQYRTQLRPTPPSKSFKININAQENILISSSPTQIAPPAPNSSFRSKGLD